MTNDEVERAIEHILNNQANFEVQLEKTNQQIARTDEQIAQTNEQIAQTDEQITQTNEQIARTDEQIAQTNEQIAQTNEQLARTDERLARTDERLTQAIERTNQRVAEMSFRFEHHAETQTQLIQVITKHVEAQGEINASIRASLAHTDKRLDALIDIVREGRNGKP